MQPPDPRAILAVLALAAPTLAVQEPPPPGAVAPQVSANPQLSPIAERLAQRLAAMEALEFAKPMSTGVDELTSLLTDNTQYVPVIDGWLYARSLRFERFMDGPQPGEVFDPERYYSPGGPPLAAILDFHRQLEERGIELLVVPIPTRLHVYPELVVGPFAGGEADTEKVEEFEGYAIGLTRFLLELTEAGVEVVDLLPALARARESHLAPDADQVFLRGNGHWSPKGVVVAARVLAERVRAAPWYESIKPRKSQEPDRFERTWSYRSQKLAEGAEPPVLEFERVLNGRGRMVEYDSDSPVLVLGDSFVSLFTPEGADLARQMHRFSGLPMDVISNPGGAAQGSRVTLARRKGGPRGKRMVIWLWASESLMMPADKWKAIDVFGR